eukprot:GHUV01028351.1.p1 GENE.GHUV01028351.1~~GHUV01028351.1.p1  ORF type:complete len:273 (+),score=112.23 GHUV01028351.1:630-1448(+)
MSGVNAHAVLKMPPATAVDMHTRRAASSFAWMRQDMRAGVLPVGHPLLHAASATSSSISSKATFMLPVLNRPGLAWLWDHRVGGRVLLPGAAYLEMAAAAARVLTSSGSITAAISSKGMSNAAVAIPALCDVTLSMPCVLPLPSQQDMSLVCQVDVVAGTVVISSTQHTAGLQKHMGCSIVDLADTSLPSHSESAGASPNNSDALRAACSEPISTVGVYESLSAAGLQYGPAHRLLTAVHHSSSSGKAAAVVSSSAAAVAAAGYLIHPTGGS